MTAAYGRAGRDELLARIAELEADRDERESVMHSMEVDLAHAQESYRHASRECQEHIDHVLKLYGDVAALRARIIALESGAEFSAMAENLKATQARCTALIDENRGWRTAFARRIDSEIPRDFVWPVRFVEPNCGTLRSLADVIAERWRQDAKWGRASARVGIPDGTGERAVLRRAQKAREACESATAEGHCTLRHILDEEVAEAFEETEPAKLRAELVQVAAVACLWVEIIDLRAKEGT